MNFEDIKKAINVGTEAGQIMAQVVISTYRMGKMINLYGLDHLDSKNFDLAIQVISYRRSSGWNDEDFWKLERYAVQRWDSDIG